MNYEINILSFIKDSGLLMLAWMLLAFAFHSWGVLFARLLKLKFTSMQKHFSNIWLGWGFCVFILAVYHLFFPINAFASILLYLPAIVVFFIKYGRKIPDYCKSIGWVKLSALFLIAIAAAAVSIQIPLNYDTGFYHLNSIRWANEHHIIKGIGNLHTRLGFNQLYFLYAASLNFHPWFNDYAFHVSNSFLYILFCFSLILSGTFIDLLFLCIFFFVPMPYYWIGNPTPDIASTLLQVVAFRYFIDAIRNPHPSRFACHLPPISEEGTAVAILQSPTSSPCGNCKASCIPQKLECNRHTMVSMAAILSAVLVSIKLSNAIFALGLGLTTLIMAKYNPFSSDGKMAIGRAFIFIGLFFAIWLTRGYIQTGYPAFPSSAGRIAFDWTVPDRLAVVARDVIYASARTCGQSFDINLPMIKENKWFDFWCKWNFFDEKNFFCGDFSVDIFSWLLLILFPMIVFSWGMGSLTMTALSMLFIGMWLSALCFKKDVWKNSRYLFCVLLADLLSIAFWWFVAPDFRFANAMFMVLFVTSLLLVKAAFDKISIKKGIKTVMMFFPVVMLVWGFWVSFSMSEFRINGMLVLNKLPMKEFITDSGLKLLVPANGSQAWDSELPSTPEPEKGLEMRGVSIDDGYRIRE